MTKQTQDAAMARASFREAKARLAAVIAESQQDDEKLAIHFGRFQTLEGSK